MQTSTHTFVKVWFHDSHISLFLSRVALQRSSGLDETGPIVWHLALCLLLSSILVAAVLVKGIKSSGKVSQLLLNLFLSTIFENLIILILGSIGNMLHHMLKPGLGSHPYCIVLNLFHTVAYALLCGQLTYSVRYFQMFVSAGCIFHSYISLCGDFDLADQRCDTRGGCRRHFLLYWFTIQFH